MMRVLLVATVQSHICQFHRPLAEILHRHGCELHVAARNNLAEKNGLTLDFADKVFDVPFQRSPFAPGNLNAYRMLKGIIEAGEYDIVHCNTPVGGVLGRLAARSARKRGTRVFYTAHGFHFYSGAPLLNWIVWYPVEKIMARYTDKLLTITREDYELAHRKFHTGVVRTHGVGANSSKYRPLSPEECLKLRCDLGYGEKDKLVLCTGELNANKNQVTAIEAIRIVAGKVPAVKLLLAGNGPSLESLKSTVRTAGLEKRVDFLGYRTDLERYVNISDIVLSCSLREGLPMNIVEGMLCGRPVVASANRGHRELIQDGVNGFIVPPRDAAATAEKLLELLRHTDGLPIRREDILERGLLYSDKAVQKELEQVYGF